MTEYFDSQGNSIRLGKSIGSGGEGTVFEIIGERKNVAKIYHRPIAADLSEKLNLLTSMATDDLAKVAAIPISIVSSIRKGPACGFIMPRITSQTEIHGLYSPAHRKLNFPDKDWAFLIHVAMNVAAAFETLHNHSIVIGDVNQGNVLVSKHGTITLIDCDSFQVQSGDRVYPCRVGVAHFTPPELQGGSFDGLHRTIHHDRFGLAMLIFHLLCMGRHPYAGQYLGTGEPPPIEKAIANFQYVYHRKSPTAQFVPPPQSLLLPAVMPKISDLFHRAFARGSEVEGSRPSSIEWHEALRDLKSQLKPCGSDIGHKFPNYLGTCPWCELERDGAPNLFVSVTSHLVDQRENELKENTDDVWHPLVDLKDQAIAFGIERPDYHTLKVVPTPIPEEVSQTDALAKLVGRVLVMCLITFVASMWIEPLFLISVTLSIGFGFWWIILVTTFGSKRERNRRERHRDEVIATLRNLEKDSATQWEEARRQFLRRFEGLELLKTEIDGLWTRYTADLDQLSMQRERRQLDAFLQSYLIREASIPLIAEWRKETLASFGVETAFDINEIRILAIDGFGPEQAAVLLAWKQSIQKQFRFSPRESIPRIDRNTVLARYLKRREDLESELIGGRETLEPLLEEIRIAKRTSEQKLEHAMRTAKQADADCAVGRTGIS